MDTKPVIGAHEESIKRGHELDPIDVKPFVKFTVAMIVIFTGAWFLCAYIFDLTAEKWKPGSKRNVRTLYDESKPNPLAKEYNDRSLEERMERLTTYAPKGKSDGEKVYAPRLEAFRVYEYHNDMPEYIGIGTTPKKGTSNSPEYHPEDLLPDRFYLEEGDKQIFVLRDGVWKDASAGVARLPIQTVIEKSKELKLESSIFKVQKNAKTEYDPSFVTQFNSKLSNAGFGTPKPQPHQEEDHHHDDDHGKDKEKHKDEPKKDPK